MGTGSYSRLEIKFNMKNETPGVSISDNLQAYYHLNFRKETYKSVLSKEVCILILIGGLSSHYSHVSQMKNWSMQT